MNSGTPETLQLIFPSFILATVLFGVTLLQTYQYFLHYRQDRNMRKFVVIMACVLDSIHFLCSVTMLYPPASTRIRYANKIPLWSLKIMGTAKTLLVVLIHSYHRFMIWTLADKVAVKQKVSRLLKSFSAVTFFYAMVVAVAFIAYLGQTPNISNFPLGFQYLIYIGYGWAAAIDCSIAAAMSILLLLSRPSSPEFGDKRSHKVTMYLIYYLIGSGLLTAACSLLVMGLYWWNPSSVLYLAGEFLASRIYANSILALFNSKSRMQQVLNSSLEFRVSTALFFGDNANSLLERRGSQKALDSGELGKRSRRGTI
ncbi:hypothetical protein GALMADRAFT_283040 [Galerina marginata CBS 339.88]|uniref:DUF6534 domain-containing protein n=1 Tax=Galerina marginata (strain CBS 339.88) TaxID=685588 RepID=A0A067SPB4_GALM3|nr:hypothetical protein GALMADRAFT_283040 [Galerina marginata CBS 339.88]